MAEWVVGCHLCHVLAEEGHVRIWGKAETEA